LMIFIWLNHDLMEGTISFWKKSFKKK
jgi:hypothetical protein